MGIGTIIGGVTSLLGGSSQKKAINKANDAQQAATQAQLQLGRESLALNKDIYNSNYNILSPFVSRGNVAGDSINALLGLPSAPTMASPLAVASGGAGMQTNPVASQVPVSGSYTGPSLAQIMGGSGGGQAGMNAYMAYYQAHPEQDPGFTDISQFHGDPYKDEAAAGSVLNGRNAWLAAHPNGATATTPTPSAAASAVTPITASQAFNNFANSAGMQFQLQQGEDAINNGYAAKGQLQSGAALKELQNYGQQTALNNYFLPYLGLLGGQQATGAGAASSIAGVGANFGNTAAAINAGMGQNIQSGANAASNAALLRGQNNANMWSNIFGGLGGLASSFGRIRGG